MLTLPTDLRTAFKEPFGPVYTETDALLADASSEETDAPLVAVGDVVTFHLRRAGRPPDVAVIDGKTKREAVGEEIRQAVETGRLVEVTNEPGTLSFDLVSALVDALDADEPTTLLVTGEEDLATLPAVVAAPLGSTVVYGQPDEGMVRVAVTAAAQAEMRDLLSQFGGDLDAVLSPLDA
ncbi:rpo operon protein [Haloferax mucosum ATCC BAA-1512]|uniref:GTP-dependent dephospho-CoA kinase n=1 Tax=Haloferax mucosum ATCC BAA-1512 TaxID=662479 RepID=M0IA08_9EURY|nr:GTP-dependent dephospho-CoA kinase family protein [Haloferax mucosum]ELZ92867.1 rpo operon protein [Haloferax mucosum ATCC BAA-1512]